MSRWRHWEPHLWPTGHFACASCATHLSHIPATAATGVAFPNRSRFLTVSKLKRLKPQLSPWHSVFRRSLVEEVSVSRLPIGHTLATHRYFLSGDSRPLCSRCGDVLSVRHVLVACGRLSNERTRFFGSIALTLQVLICDDSSQSHSSRISFSFLHSFSCNFLSVFLKFYPVCTSFTYQVLLLWRWTSMVEQSYPSSVPII